MTPSLEGPRVLLAAAADAGRPLRAVFRHPCLAHWEVVDAGSYEQANFFLQHDRCDVILLDESLCRAEDEPGLGRLLSQHEVPTLLLAHSESGWVQRAMSAGISQWLPREQVLERLELLASALQKEIQRSDARHRARTDRQLLRDCRRQIRRLLQLLWEVSPADAQTQWHSQRYVLERLHEELARSRRYELPLTVVLGELRAPEDRAVRSWAVEQVLRAKRRSDVAGQYGPDGFLLLLCQTPELGAAVVCRRLKILLEQAPPTPVALFFGVASYSGTNSTPQRLLSCAEQRLDEAKAACTDAAK